MIKDPVISQLHLPPIISTEIILREYLCEQSFFFREASSIGITARVLVCGMMMITYNRSRPSDCLGIVDHG